MAHEVKLIGEFLGRRAKNPDTSSDPWDPVRDKSPLESFPNPDLTLSSPATLPFQVAPTLSKPGELPGQVAPTLSKPGELPGQVAPTLSSPATLSFQVAPTLSKPGELSGQIAPILSSPTASSFQVAPTLSKPEGELPGQVAPTLSKPRELSDQVAPTLSKPRELPDQVAPALSSPADLLFQIDDKISKIMHDIDEKGQYVNFTTGPGTQALNPFLYAKSISRLGAHLGKAGLALFAGTQLGLFLLNRHGKIWNPATIIPVPLLQNFIPAALDVLTGTPRILTGYDDSQGTGLNLQGGSNFYSKNHGNEGGEDIHAALALGEYNEVRIVHYPPFIETITFGGRATFQQGLGIHLGAMSQISALIDNPFGISERSTGKPLVEAALDLRNKYSPGGDGGSESRTYSEKATFIVDDLIKNVLIPGSSNKKIDPHFFLDVESELARYKREPKLSKIGLVNSPILGKRNINFGEQRPDIKEVEDNTKFVSNSGLALSTFIHGIIPSKLRGENDFGFVTTVRGKSPADQIPDDVAYIPLSITDLRSVGNSYRTVYFRPLNVKISEAFTPQWNKAHYFGRVDPVASYESTGRAFSISFSLIAFGPEDLKNIYQKLHWLISMVYPSYDKNLLYVSGPVVRMRVGDIMNAVGPEGSRGLPGIIESLDFDYNEGPWELENGLKVPRNIGVSLSFTVLHDRPIGVGAEGRFGGLGEIDSTGKFIPPGLNSIQSAGSDDKEKLADASLSGEKSFRSIDTLEEDSPNRYTSFTDTLKEK